MDRPAAYGAAALLRCPAVAAPGEAGLHPADRCHSLGSLFLPPAALPSLPGIEPVRILLRGILSYLTNSEDNALCARIKAYKNSNFSAQLRKLFRYCRKMFKIRKNRHALKNPNLAVFFAQRR